MRAGLKPGFVFNQAENAFTGRSVQQLKALSTCRIENPARIRSWRTGFAHPGLNCPFIHQKNIHSIKKTPRSCSLSFASHG